MALLPTMYQSLAQPRYGERMMYDAAPIMDGGYGLLDGAMLAPAVEQQVLPAAQPMTQEDRDARRIAANTPPQGTLITSSLSNKGNATGFGQGNTFRVRDDQEVRITDNKGKVLFSGFGPEAARQAVALGQSITNEKGNKAGWMIQTGDRTINADGTVGSTRWNDVAREKVNKSVLGKIADVALPIAASFIPGVGPVLGAALGSAASSVAQGRSLENTLLRAGLSAASAGAVGATGADKAIGGVLGKVGSTVAGKTAEEVAKQAGGDIVVTALSKALQGAGGALGQAALSQAGQAGLSEITGFKTPAEQFAQQPLPEALLPPADIYAGIDPIDVLANRATATAPNYGGVLSGVFEPIATEFLPKSVLPEPLPSEPAIADETIVVTAPQSVAAPSPIAGFETAIPATIGGALTAAQTAGTPPSGKDGVLGTGLTIPQLLSIGGVGADLLKNLLAGGDGAGAGTPYVSPFGTGVGFAPGQDMRANPTILDYERYGFGPEAMFFQPGYGLLSAGAAPQAQPIMAVPQAQPAMVTNPRYEPLI